VEFVVVALAVLAAAVIQETVIERVRDRRSQLPASARPQSDSR
jgi:hypothetical protein